MSNIVCKFFCFSLLYCGLFFKITFFLGSSCLKRGGELFTLLLNRDETSQPELQRYPELGKRVVLVTFGMEHQAIITGL